MFSADRRNHEVYFKPLGAKRLIVINDIAVVFAFPFFSFYLAVVFCGNVFHPGQKFFVNIVEFKPVSLVGTVCIFFGKHY